MIDGALSIDSGTGPRTVALDDYLDIPAEESAIESANAWIKALRHASVDGQPMRRRFTYRGDSLWWFTELYLHKTQIVWRIFRTIVAVERLIERERPREIRYVAGDRLLRGVAPQIAAAKNVRWEGPAGFGSERRRLLKLRLRARALTAAALAGRLRKRDHTSGARSPIAAFVHSAFWRAGGTDGRAESYIGPVLAALEEQAPRDGVRYIGVGPSENFAARRWWRTFLQRASESVTPVESFAPLPALAGSRRLWRERNALLRSLWHSDDVRRRAVIRGCDCWPAIREELAGVALLQWPWSARAMDEAAAALDALQPRVAVTYAEAGGWGRALVLECRRRAVASVGLQHGFIFRHWLNYRHEADEMRPDDDNAADGGFPHPSLTLVFDAYAAQHLEHAARFPAASIAITGSARLDALVDSARRLTDADLARVRRDIAGPDAGPFVLLVTKFREARRILPPLIDAVATLAGVRLAIKTHPAETSDVYDPIVRNAAHVTVLPASAPLAPLLGAAHAVVTVNSTVALDALVLGVPSLVIGLPNNLSPFVDAGVMAGAANPGEIAPLLDRILYDQGFRQQLANTRRGFLERYGIAPDGRAAARAAAAVVRLIEEKN
jgi:hypothetical protein